MSDARFAGFRGSTSALAPCALLTRAALLALPIAVGLAGPVSAAPAPLDTGFSDRLYQSGDPVTRGQWLDETVNARSEVVRVNVLWRDITSGQPSDPRNPADAAYNFSAIDGAVADAQARGLEVLLTFYFAPNYAEGENKPGNVPAGTWKPKPGAVEDFAFALASRYPTVDYIQAWNEPTLDVYLTPQYDGKKAKSPDIYKDLLNAAYAGVNDAGNGQQVVTAGAAPYGEPPGGDRFRPIAFWRKVFCLKGRKQLQPTSCAPKPRFDVFAHHPIDTSGGPHRSALHPDDAATPDLKNLVRVLRKAERTNQVDGGKHPVWATELWWESDPPDKFEGVPLHKHAMWLEEALYVLWKQGARVVINLQIRDGEFDENNPFGENVTGIFKFNGKKKPAFTAWRFPFVVHGGPGTSERAWGKAPESGQLTIERRAKHGWVAEKHFNVAAGDVFNEKLHVSGNSKLRAEVGGAKSLATSVRQ